MFRPEMAWDSSPAYKSERPFPRGMAVWLKLAFGRLSAMCELGSRAGRGWMNNLNILETLIPSSKRA